jgi:hypothetical protein
METSTLKLAGQAEPAKVWIVEVSDWCDDEPDLHYFGSEAVAQGFAHAATEQFWFAEEEGQHVALDDEPSGDAWEAIRCRVSVEHDRIWPA